jgi:hypothetical protein
LRKISVDGHIIQLYPSFLDNKFSIDSKSIGRKIATVSTNFCDVHDTSIFLPIESKDYVKGNKEQEFLFAYRAFAKEYHVKREAKNVLENANNSSKITGNKLAPNLLGTDISLEQLEREKSIFNNSLIQREFGILATHVIELRHEYHIAASSAFVMEYDFKGNQINNLSNLDQDLKHSFLTIFPQKGKTFIIFSVFRKYRKDFSFIRKQIMNRRLDEQKMIISNLLVTHIENFVISPKIWNQLSENEKEKIKITFQESIESFTNRLYRLKDINLFLENK